MSEPTEEILSTLRTAIAILREKREDEVASKVEAAMKKYVTLLARLEYPREASDA